MTLVPISSAAVRTLTEHFYLAFTVWREARGETREAQYAVAFSILNRVERPSWWGTTIDEVVTKKWQYSSLTDPNDPQLSKAWPKTSDPSWVQCVEVAAHVLQRAISNPVPGADSYYDDSISPPNWTTSARFVRKIGRLNFFDVDKDYENA